MLDDDSDPFAPPAAVLPMAEEAGAPGSPALAVEEPGTPAPAVRPRASTVRSTGVRVAHLTSVHPYNDPRIFHKQCHSLARAGFEVYLVAPVAKPRFEKGIHVVPAGTWTNRAQRLALTVPRVVWQALRLRPHVVHIHDPELLVVAQILRLTGAKVVYDIHEDYVTSIQQKEYLPRPLRALVAQAMTYLERGLSAGCHRIIAERYYAERFPSALQILNYPLAGELGGAARATSQEPLPTFDPQYSWYLYTGNVALDRGALTQLDLLRAHRRAALCSVGRCAPAVAAAIRVRAQELGIAPERILLIGANSYVSRERIHQITTQGPWVAGLALFPPTLHYMRKELTKFFEYMEAGLPILASDFPAWTDMLHERVGYTVEVGNLNALRERAQQLEADELLRSRFSARGRELVAERFNWTLQEEKLVAFYRNLFPA